MYENRPSGYNSDIHAHRIVALLLRRQKAKQESLDEIALEESRACLD
jgi:hypothetical protein